MIVSHIRLKNWRNFREVDVPLQERQFLIGANATGKSNFLDVFRFLRDLSKSDGGGLQAAVRCRGGVSKIRSLAARKDPEIVIDVSLSDPSQETPRWRYVLGFKQEPRGQRSTFLTKEQVYQDGRQLVNRPTKEDGLDDARLTQTNLEQINENRDFREIAGFFESVTYLHLVPQLLRKQEASAAPPDPGDPFGLGFLERVARTPEATRQKRLRKIENVLKIAVPQLRELQFEREPASGRPHLQALYSHWRPHAGWQREDQFSDGTLRLIGLFWSLLDGRSMLLLEEPELSLNAEIVAQLAPLLKKMQRPRRRQILISTHSQALLDDRGIDGSEVLVFQPDREGTSVTVASEEPTIAALLHSGFSVAEAALPKSAPETVRQLTLFDDE